MRHGVFRRRGGRGILQGSSCRKTTVRISLDRGGSNAATIPDRIKKSRKKKKKKTRTACIAANAQQYVLGSDSFNWLQFRPHNNWLASYIYMTPSFSYFPFFSFFFLFFFLHPIDFVVALCFLPLPPSTRSILTAVTQTRGSDSKGSFSPSSPTAKPLRPGLPRLRSAHQGKRLTFYNRSKGPPLIFSPRRLASNSRCFLRTLRTRSLPAVGGASFDETNSPYHVRTENRGL